MHFLCFKGLKNWKINLIICKNEGKTVLQSGWNGLIANDSEAANALLLFRQTCTERRLTSCGGWIPIWQRHEKLTKRFMTNWLLFCGPVNSWPIQWNSVFCDPISSLFSSVCVCVCVCDCVCACVWEGDVYEHRFKINQFLISPAFYSRGTLELELGTSQYVR